MHKIAQLTLNPSNRVNTTSDIFIASPDAEKELLAGKLFAIIEIESKNTSDLKLINFLIENLNGNYYQNEKMILRERVKTVKIEHIFESALAKTNKNLVDFLHEEKIKFNPHLINATVGVIHEDSLYFSNIGKNKAFLIYKKRGIQNKEDYNITDINKRSDTDERKAPINSAKLFSNVISGIIPKPGCFLLSNEFLPEYLSGNKLIEIVASLPPASAAEQIKNELSKIEHYVSFLAIIIKNMSGMEKEKNESEKIPQKTGESITKLNQVEEKTEKLLTPGGYVNIKKWLNIKNNFFQKSPEKRQGQVKKDILREKIFFKKRANLLIIKKIWLTVKNIITYIFGLTVYIFKLASDKNKIINLAQKIKSSPLSIKIFFQKIYFWFNNLSKKNKILAGLTLVFLVLFSQSVIFLSLKNKNAKREEAFINILKPVEQKLNQAEASLLYSNESGARILLGEIDELLGQLPKKTENEKKQAETFEKKYNELAEKIRNVIKIENPRELADFSKLKEGASPENIIFTENKIYSGDSSKKTIYLLDLKDKSSTIAINNSPGVRTLFSPTLSSSGNIDYFNSDSIIQLNSKNNELTSSPIKFKSDPSAVGATSIFNNKLYLVDKIDGQIYAYKKDQTGFTQYSPWLKKTADFNNAANIAIDGHIYILQKNGQILKYLKGQPVEFNLDAVEPIIENAKKAILADNLRHIYILEPTEKRLILFNKDGKFLAQYKFEQLDNLKDFLVDENKKIIYLLNGSVVYEFDMAPLK